MPFNWAGAGAGAAAGLEALIHRKMLEDQFAFAQKKEANDQDFRNRTLSATEQDRRDRLDYQNRSLESIQADRIANEQERVRQHDQQDTQNRALQDDRDATQLRLNLEQTPQGAAITPEEKDRATKLGFPAAMFPEKQSYQGLSGDDSAESVPVTQRMISLHKQDKAPVGGPGPVREDAQNRLIRVNPDGTTSVIQNPERTGPATAFHPPDRVLIQSGPGYVRRTDATAALANGQDVPAADTTSSKTRREIAGHVTHQLGDIQQQAAKLNEDGLFGPVMSRVRQLATKAGTIDEFSALIGSDKSGDPTLDYEVGKFATSLALAASGAGMAHYMGRAGSSPVAMNAFKDMLSDSSTLEMFNGRVAGMDQVMSEYAARNPTQLSGGRGAAPGGATPAPAPAPAAAPAETMWQRLQREAAQRP